MTAFLGLAGFILLAQLYFARTASVSLALATGPTPVDPIRGDSVTANTNGGGEATTFTGIVLPHSAVDVATQLPGQVTRLLFQTGQTVKSGQILAVIESPTIGPSDIIAAEADVTASELGLARSRVLLEQAQAKLARGKRLSAEGLSSIEQVEDLEYQVRLASGSLASDEATVTQARAVLRQRRAVAERLRIRAPFDGDISTHYAEVGATLSAGAPILRLVDTLPLVLRFAVSGRYRQSLAMGSVVNAFVDAQQLTLQGAVRAVAPEVDTSSQMVVVEAIIDLARSSRPFDPRFVAGQAATVTIARR